MSSGVEFDSDINPSQPQRGSYPSSYSFTRSPEQKGLAGWLIRHGLAKSGSSANAVLIGVIVLNIVLIYILLKFL